jgi:hypothetical protein
MFMLYVNPIQHCRDRRRAGPLHSLANCKLDLVASALLGPIHRGIRVCRLPATMRFANSMVLWIDLDRIFPAVFGQVSPAQD